MKCSLRNQHKLLDLARLDNDIEVLEAQAVNLPEKQRLDEVLQHRAVVHSETVAASVVMAEMDAELFKLNSDIAKLRRREADDRQRLTVSLDRDKRRDLTHDISAAQRIRARLESQRDGLEVQRDQQFRETQNRDGASHAIDTGDAIAAAQRALDEAKMVVRGQIEDKHRAAQRLKDDLPVDLVGAYDIQRDDHGIGVAVLDDRVCQGCYMALDNAR